MTAARGLRCIALLLPALLAGPLPVMAAPAAPRPSVLADPSLFRKLAAAKKVQAFSLEGEWSGACDSLVRAGGSAMDCFVRTAALDIRAHKAIPKLLEILTTCTWVRTRGWTSPSTPSIGFKIGIDSLGVDLLVSLQGRKAMISRPGEGCIAAFLPDSLSASVAWCLWAVDPVNPEALPVIRSEMRRRGLDPDTAPPPDIEFVNDVPRVKRERAEDAGSIDYDEPPVPVTHQTPIYPEMAREAQIQGRVVLRVLVGRDGRVKKIEVVSSISYLDEAAKSAVLHWVYKPALKAGQPVAAWVEVPVDFHF